MIRILQETKQECCGCGACMQACPVKCISMEEDEEGFLYPDVNAEVCIVCGRCEKVCPVLQKKEYRKDVKEIPKTVGGWHKNEEIRYESSSGGVFTLLAEYVIEKGGIVYGCTLDENFQAIHIGVENKKELAKLRGSKYLQSNIGCTYQKAEYELKRGRMVLFIGTPCQTAGLCGFLGREYRNLYLCDFICHGVPSPKVFRDYVDYLEQKYRDKAVSFQFRTKDKGWSDLGQMGTKIKFCQIGCKRFTPVFCDAYMNGFLDDIYLRPSCYSCHFKGVPKYYADITIADFWGVKKVDAQLYDGKGTSLVMVHNAQGEELLAHIQSSFFCKECDFKKAVQRNPSLVKSAGQNGRRDIFFKDYHTTNFSVLKRRYMSIGTRLSHKAFQIIWSLLEKVIRKMITLLAGLFHLNLSDSQLEGFLQFVRFSIVGVSNVMVAYLTNILTLFLLRKSAIHIDYMIANLAAFAFSVFWSFQWNSRFVFTQYPGEKRNKWKTLLKTYLSYGFTGIILNNILASFWIYGVGISKYISPLLNLPISVPVNFFMNKRWVYGKREEKDSIKRGYGETIDGKI